MTVPGSNLLSAALTLIASQPVRWFRFVSRNTLPNGVYVSNFAPAELIEKGSVQPVPRNKYEQYGLDVQKSYVTWWTSIQANDLQRGESGDQIEWGGRRYQLTSATDWLGEDGWQSIIAVDIGAAHA